MLLYSAAAGKRNVLLMGIPRADLPLRNVFGGESGKI